MVHFEKDALIKLAITIVLTCVLAISIWKLYEIKSNRNGLLIQSSEGIIKTISSHSKNNLEETVPLNMYVIGEKPTDFEMVLEEVNLILNQLIGVDLSVNFISEKDIGVDYHTIFAGGADFDLIEIYPYYYNLFASKYAYMNLTEDMLRKCAPQLSMSELDTMRINNMVYAVPSKAHLENSIVLLIRGDIAKTYGIDSINSISELERYMGLVKNNEDHIIPFDIGLNGIKLMQLLCTQPNHIRLYDDFWIGIQDNKREPVIWLPETNYFMTYLETIHSWQKLKFIPEEASSKRIVLYDSFIQGSSAIAIGEVFEMENLKRKVDYEHPEYMPQIVTIGDEPLAYYDEPIHHGIAIKNGSQYAAKSLMLVELIRTNKEIFRLLNYGIEGIHYYVTEDGYYEPLADSIKYPIYNHSVWCMTDQFRLKYTFENKNIVPFDQVDEPNIKMYASSMNLDVLDLTQLESIQKNYGYPLTVGSFNSINQGTSEYFNQMKEISFQTYYNEVKTSINSHRQ